MAPNVSGRLTTMRVTLVRFALAYVLFQTLYRVFLFFVHFPDFLHDIPHSPFRKIV